MGDAELKPVGRLRPAACAAPVATSFRFAGLWGLDLRGAMGARGSGVKGQRAAYLSSVGMSRRRIRMSRRLRPTALDHVEGWLRSTLV
jgi:hypothetical protein